MPSMHRNALRLPLTSANRQPPLSFNRHFPSTKRLLKTTGWGLTNCLQQTGEGKGEGKGEGEGEGKGALGRLAWVR